MKLYISHCKSCRKKLSLNIEAPNRYIFRMRYGQNFLVRCSSCYHQNMYNVNQVFAESDSNSTVGGGVVGGLVGLLGGPLGLIIGGAVGGAIGNEIDATEKKKVDSFNSSR